MSEERNLSERLFGRIVSPIERLMHNAAAAGIVLMAVTAAALAAAAWLGDEALHHAWEQRLAISLTGRFNLDLTLHHWVNDGAMALFFLMVGLELKREMLVGELASIKDAALPIFAAAGGMLLPGLIYAAFNHGTAGAAGWGIPTATDIAFAIGILAILAKRIPRNLVIFLTALAIADDLGAVILIAIFYTAQIDAHWIHAAGALFVLLLVFNRGGLRHPLPYAAIGLILWYALLRSGVHATLAGVLLAIAVPSRPASSPAQYERLLGDLQSEFTADRLDPSTPDDPLRNRRMAEIAAAAEHASTQVQSPLQRMEHAIAPWVAFLVVPVFAVANAGIDLRHVRWSDALSAGVTLGVAAGLVAGKVAGVSLFSWAAVRLGLARLPAGVAWRHVVGAAWLAGIGFTMSLFIGQLAFDDRALVEEAKLGILLGSAISAAIGFAWLFFCGSHDRSGADRG
ncbi:MAG: Na+/H+ antiporter NhaA [Usitatibacter sp.]